MYGILSIQLLVTIAIICPFVFSDRVKLFAYQNRWTYWVAFGLTMVREKDLQCVALQ